jgi:hypothetical protein
MITVCLINMQLNHPYLSAINISNGVFIGVSAHEYLRL